MTKKDLMKIPLKYFGLPKYRKYPMQDEIHLKAAIAYFYNCKPKDRRELARNIVKRHTELNSKIEISTKNPLYKFVPDSMKSITESIIEPLITQSMVRKLRPILEDADIALIEVLISKNTTTDVDSLDAEVPVTHLDRDKLLNAMKSVIMNDDDGKEFPIIYTDFPVLSKVLHGNNGGIQIMEDCTIIKYDGSLNESCSLNPVQDLEHIQFATLLREWDEGYMNGTRNFTYDRLIIESWKTRVEALCESYKSSKNNIAYQKMIDLGIQNVEDSNTGAIGGIIDNITSKADEMSVPVDVSTNTTDNTITIASINGPDGTMIQKGLKKNDDAEKYK